MAIFIPEDKIFEIKNAADIVEVVSEAVLLKKTGKNFVGLCPFHSEKTPSFTVSPQKQMFYCFGCAAGGNVITFIMKHQETSFPEAAMSLARRYGIDIPLPKISPEQKRQISERERLFVLNQSAMDFFRRKLLDGTSGEKAMTYLKERGVSQEIIETFNLGFAPEGWDNLINYFSKRKALPAVVEKSGLIVERKNKNGFYDRFRERIIFPIFNLEKNVIGFGGRVMDNAMPKYLNSPETPVYKKSRSLYGLHLAKSKCRAHETVYIVEGYLDLIMLHQHDIKNSVATLGTSLTREHVQILRGLVGKDGRVILVFDSDDAGMKAALRSVEIFMKAGVDAYIMVLPEGYDPDAYLLEFGQARFLDVAAKSKSLMSFLIDTSINKHGQSVEGKIRVISEIKETLTSIDDSIARSLYIKELAERMGIEEAAILEKVRELTDRNKRNGRRRESSYETTVRNQQKTGFQSEDQKKTQHGKWLRLEHQIISMMLQFPPILTVIAERKILDLFENNGLKYIGQLLLEHKDQPEFDLFDIIEEKNQKSMVASMAIGENMWSYEGCLSILDRFESIQGKTEKTLIGKIKEAEKNNDFELLTKLLKKKHKLAVLTEKKKMAILK